MMVYEIMRVGDRWWSPDLGKPRNTNSSYLTNFKVQFGKKAWHPRQETIIVGDFRLGGYQDPKSPTLVISCNFTRPEFYVKSTVLLTLSYVKFYFRIYSVKFTWDPAQWTLLEILFAWTLLETGFRNTFTWDDLWTSLGTHLKQQIIWKYLRWSLTLLQVTLTWWFGLVVWNSGKSVFATYFTWIKSM